MDIETRLLNLKREIENRKIAKARLEGELSQTLKQLNELGCKDIQSAIVMLKNLELEIQTQQKTIEDSLVSLESAVWN